MGKIAIINPGGIGDILLSSSVLKYKDELWPGKEVVWYCHDQFKYVFERIRGLADVRPWVADTSYDDVETKIISATYLCNRSFPSGTSIVDMHRIIFGVMDRPWHPCLEYTSEDESVAMDFLYKLPFKKSVMLETVYYSSQSFLDDAMTVKMMDQINNAWGECNFIFASTRRRTGETQPVVPPRTGKGVASCSHLPLWSVIALYNKMDAFIGVNSGLTIAVCSWMANEKVPRLELINGETTTTSMISRGPLSTALNGWELPAKLGSFLQGKFDYPRPA